MRAIRILFKSSLLILILGLEIYSLQLIVEDQIAVQDLNLISVFFYHFMVSAPAAYLISQILVPGHDGIPLKNYVFFLLVIFYLPVLGLSGLILAIPLAIFHRSRSEKSDLPININKIRELSNTQASVGDSQTIDLGNLHGLYRSKNYHKRLQAVYATLKLKDLEAVPLLHKALKDPVDDIRLLAYALLDRKENHLSKRILKNKQALEKHDYSNNKILILRIVNDYWELVRLGLIQGEAQNHVLNMAQKYVELGLKQYPQDLGFNFLYAQILLKLKHFQQAYEQFKKSEELGMDRSNLLIYYAEIAFHNHQHQEVKRLLQAIELPTNYPKLSAITQFWQKAS
ncbi:hypothetical protein ABF87_13855 [Nitrosomonas sp. JL21]|nr:hypothetical protein [Nitrosomonas sp. JL21]